MTWSKFDDRYDEHPKVRDAFEQDPAAIALHVMATTHCCRLESDGVIQPRWLKAFFADMPSPARRQKQLLEVMARYGLFDLLPAGHVITLAERTAGSRAPSREFQDVTVGPFAEDRWLVHDFLDRHLSRRQLKLQRDRDAARKPKKGDDAPDPTPASTKDSPVASQWDATKDSHGESLGPDPTRPDPTGSPQPPDGGRPPFPTRRRGHRARDLEQFGRQLTAYQRWLQPRLGDVTANDAEGYLRLVVDSVHFPTGMPDDQVDDRVVAAFRSRTRQPPEQRTAA